MKTFQEFAAAKERGETERFLLDAVADHRASPGYREAVAAQAYYNGENPTIRRYEKLVYDMQGVAHRDPYAANHKLTSGFFTFAVDQEVSYLLGNGVSFGDPSTKARLGRDFDLDLMELLEAARVDGMAFGLWDFGRLAVFRLTEFVPLWDEETGALRAGIRFWRVGGDSGGRPMRLTLYEEEGCTHYSEASGGRLFAGERRPYRQTVRGCPADGYETVEAASFPALPIVPLFGDRSGRSALAGRRGTIDALDLACSNLVNNVDEGNLIYWVISNAGGMDELDDMMFVNRLKTLHVAHADGDASAVPHTVEAPYAGTQAAVDMLLRRLYDDFQAFNAAAVSAGDQTATAIRASYAPLDLKTDKIERQVTRFIHGLLSLLGISDEPSYTRSQIVNRLEETRALVLMEPYVGAGYVRRKLLTLEGDIDMADAQEAEACSVSQTDPAR